MPSPRSVLVLARSSAGRAEQEKVAAALAVLREEVETEVVTPEGSADVQQAVARAGGRQIVVMGGDGSLHRCLQAVADQQLLEGLAPIGLVPLGTGNDFARAVGIPLDLAEAARVALHGEPMPADLLLDQRGEVVVNVVHAGVAAEATVHAQDVKGLLGTTAYALGAVRAGVTASGWQLRVMVDGETVLDGTRRALMVTLALGTSIGGGARVAPAASPTDGLAEVVVSTATGPLARMSYALDLRRGRHTRRDDVVRVRGREVTIEAVDEGDAFRINADGEVGGREQARTWTVLPRAWRCRIPSGSQGSA